MKANLDDLLEAVQRLASDDTVKYQFSRKTGELIQKSEWEDDAEDEFLTRHSSNDKDLIELTSSKEINNYGLMQNFICSLPFSQVKEKLSAALKMHSLKKCTEVIRSYNIANDWYNFRDYCYERYIRSWCSNNHIKLSD
ncbi:MAG: hypothetical protein J5934_08325 [Succinivibrio sp.]|nr:hypothetical protein [Succinivibrio sp.]